MAVPKNVCATLLFVLVEILCVYSSSAFFTLKTRVVKREIYSSTKNYESLINETTSDAYKILDTCNTTAEDGTNTNIQKRSMLRPLNNSVEITEEVPDTVDFSMYSEKFLTCLLTTVEPECYQMFQNGSVFIPLYGRLFDRTKYIIKDGVLSICPNFFDDHMKEKFSGKIGTVSIVGVSISTVCIILHLIMFSLVEKMRNFPGYCLISLCFALLTFYISSFAQNLSSENNGCVAIGMIKFYSLLSSFFWLNVIAFDVWKSIKMATTKLRLSTTRHVLVRFALYSCYGWGSPLLIVIITIIIDALTTDIRFKLIFKKETCWFANKNALLFYFALPFFVLLFVNIVFFILSFYMITQATMNNSNSGSQANLKSRLFLVLRLSTAMGLMWLFGVIATVTQEEWLFIVYSACNALQGVFIFFSFTLNAKTIKACGTLIKKKKSSVSPATTLNEFGHSQYNTLQ